MSEIEIETKVYVNENDFFGHQGMDCCSTSVISFHYMPYNEMYVFDFLLHYVRHPSSRSHDSSYIEIDELPRKLDFDDIRARLNNNTNLDT